MLAHRRKSGFRRSRSLIATLTAIAFALLVSLAALHVHTTEADQDGCAICTAVIGKVSGPPPVVAALPPVFTAFVVADTCDAPAAPRRAQNLLPPSCGPPVAV